MEQKLKVELEIKIPDEYVLITKIEYEELQHNRLVGRWWTMQDLEEKTGMKAQWIKENVLYIPKFKKQLEHFVHYPKSQGEKWSFQATKMKQFLEDNFHQVFNGR